MRKALYHEITPQEMLYIREHEHLTNQQIADKLGCSYQTVLNYIGPMKKKEKQPGARSTVYRLDKYACPVCEKCGFRPFVGYIPTLGWMEDRGYKYCPYCGLKIVQFNEDSRDER